MTIVERRLDEIRPYEKNPRRNDDAVEYVANSIREFGWKQPIVIDRDGVIIAGHTRYKAAQQLGLESVPCLIADDLTDDQVKAYRLADNKVSEMAEWDFDLLTAELAEIPEIDMADFGFAEIEISVENEEIADIEEKGNLKTRYLVPPFSVIYANKPDWLARKRAWVEKGIRSELGRSGQTKSKALSDGLIAYTDQIQRGRAKKNGTLFNSMAAIEPDYMWKKTAVEERLGRKISRAEFEDLYLDAGRGSRLSDTGTSIFDPVLTECLLYWFTARGDKVIDPFAGGSVRGIVTNTIGRTYTGIDLREEQIAANMEQGQAICPGNMPVWICGDSMNVKTLAPGEYDFILTCPPYGNLEIYGDDPADISNMDDADFDKTYYEIMRQTVDILKNDRFAALVVGNYRDKKGFLRDLVGLTVRAMESAGARYYNDFVVVTPCGSLPIRAGKPFQSARKMGRTHQYCLVFVKGDPKKATKRIGEVEIPDLSLYEK